MLSHWTLYFFRGPTLVQLAYLMLLQPGSLCSVSQWGEFGSSHLSLNGTKWVSWKQLAVTSSFHHQLFPGAAHCAWHHKCSSCGEDGGSRKGGGRGCRYASHWAPLFLEPAWLPPRRSSWYTYLLPLPFVLTTARRSRLTGPRSPRKLHD